MTQDRTTSGQREQVDPLPAEHDELDTAGRVERFRKKYDKSLAAIDRELQRQQARRTRDAVKSFADDLQAAQELGEIRAELDPLKLAQQLMVGLAGSAALVKGLITTEEVMELLESMIDLWT